MWLADYIVDKGVYVCARHSFECKDQESMNTEHLVRSVGFVSKPAQHGRFGELMLPHGNVSTPCLFPVVCLMTGPTALGGGIWKYVLQADVTNSILRRNLPVMSQVLHFLDFHSLTAAGLNKWRQLGLRRRYNEE